MWGGGRIWRPPARGGIGHRRFFDIEQDRRQDAESGSQKGSVRPDALVAGNPVLSETAGTAGLVAPEREVGSDRGRHVRRMLEYCRQPARRVDALDLALIRADRQVVLAYGHHRAGIRPAMTGRAGRSRASHYGSNIFRLHWSLEFSMVPVSMHWLSGLS